MIFRITLQTILISIHAHHKKQRVDYMKDETEDDLVREFVWEFTPKSMVCENANGRKFANKGIRRNVCHEKYKKLCATISSSSTHKQIDSKLRVLRTISKKKEVSLLATKDTY